MGEQISFDEIRQLIREGQSPECIAIKYGLEIDEITKLTKQEPAGETDDRVTLLSNLHSCQELLVIAEQEYKADPNQRNAAAVTSFVQTSQALITQLGQINSNDVKVAKLIESGIQPMIRGLIASLGGEISVALDSGNFGLEARKAFETVSKNFGKEATIAYKGLLTKIEEIFNCSFNINNSEQEEEEQSEAKDGTNGL